MQENQTPPTEPKSIFKSKTFWFNIISLVVFIAIRFGFGDAVKDWNIEEIAAVIVTVGNLYFRTITSEPVKLK